MSGAALALAPPATPIVVPTPDEAFALDAEMQAFIAPLKGLRDPHARMFALIEAMEARGMLNFSRS